MPIPVGAENGPRSYAEPDEYAAWALLDATPAAVTPALMARASELVDDHIATAVYDTDSDGYPTLSAVGHALRDAVCAQVEFWLTGDEEDDVLGPLQGIATGGLQLQMGAGANRTTPMYLAPRAARALRRGGLLYGAVSSS